MQKGLRVRKLGTPATGSRMYDKDIQEPRGINVRRQGGATEEGGLPLLLASFSLLLSTSSTFSPAVTHLSPLCCLMSFFPPFFLSSPFLSFTHTSSHRSSLCSLMFFFPSSFFSYCLPSQPTAGHHSPLCSAAQEIRDLNPVTPRDADFRKDVLFDTMTHDVRGLSSFTLRFNSNNHFNYILYVALNTLIMDSMSNTQ